MRNCHFRISPVNYSDLILSYGLSVTFNFFFFFFFFFFFWGGGGGGGQVEILGGKLDLTSGCPPDKLPSEPYF